MKRTLVVWIAQALILSISISPVCADQLAWNSLQDCETAVNALPSGSILISYCSNCNNEFVEIWQVRKAVVAYTGNEDNYQVNIFSKKLYRSAAPFSSGQFSDSVRYEELSAGSSGCEELYTLEDVDLAYIYVYTPATMVQNFYECLGLHLGLKCEVPTEYIVLPENISERLQSMSEVR